MGRNSIDELLPRFIIATCSLSSSTVPRCASGLVSAHSPPSHYLSPTYSELTWIRQVLARGAPDGVPASYRALAYHRGVPHPTLYHRAKGSTLDGRKARDQQYYHCV